MKLSELLESWEGEESIELIIPYPFLPPRFQRLADNRNMRLLISEDFEIEVHWEGAQLTDCLYLSSRAACQLLRQVGVRMSRYRADLTKIGKFLDYSRLPKAIHPGVADPSGESEKGLAEKREEVKAISSPAAENLATEEYQMGGESPLPPWEP